MKLLSFSMGLILLTSLIAHEAIDDQNQALEIVKGKLYHPGTFLQFKDMLAQSELVVVDFYADWCHPCRQMHKVFDALAQDAQLDSVLFVKVDTEAHQSLSNEYNIRSLPTIILFVDGKPIRTLHGAYSKAPLKKIIQDTFAI